MQYCHSAREVPFDPFKVHFVAGRATSAAGGSGCTAECLLRDSVGVSVCRTDNFFPEHFTLSYLRISIQFRKLLIPEA